MPRSRSVEDTFRAEASARLREAGLRATGPRLAVLTAMRRMGGHRTADEVHAGLIEQDVRLPRTSVYNALAALSSAGLVNYADIGPGAAVYETAGEWHHHFVCRRCGAVLDVPCAAGGKPCLTPDIEVGVVEEAQVIFRGVCADCAASA
ncbi:MAG: transcriptional repressor [Streptosporangiales bacterium]|nr:transcriptional repressor [Streptosporangiales bacterium]